MIFDAAQHRIVVFVEVEDAHGYQRHTVLILV